MRLFYVGLACVAADASRNTGGFCLSVTQAMLVTLCEIGEEYFRLLGTNDFRVKAEKEKFTAAGARCHRNLKYQTFSSSFGRLRQKLH